MRPTRRHAALAPLALLLATGCGPSDPEWSPKVICHNANCVEPADVKEDDTLPALAASLALRGPGGAPLLDGVEIDTFWYGAEERCLFAHDLDSVETADPLADALTTITDYQDGLAAAGGALTRTGEPFSVYIELKGHVGPAKSEKHSPAQRVAHAECGRDAALTLRDAAAAGGWPLEVVFTSFDPDLLVALDALPEVRDLRASDGPITAKLGILQGVPAPLDSQSESFANIPPELDIDVVSTHPHWARHASLEAAGSKDWSLSIWMFTLVPETLDAITRYQPDAVTTSEANAFTRWLDR